MGTKSILIWIGILAIAAVIVWQAVTFSGVPDPLGKDLNAEAAILSCGVLIFREGLGAILVLAAVTAAITRDQEKNYGYSIAVGAGMGFAAAVATWFIVVAVL